MTSVRAQVIAWLVACAAAPGATVLLACSAGPFATAALFGLVLGCAQGLAVRGTPRRRILWAIFTTLGSWAAFPVGLIGGVVAALALVLALSFLPLGRDTLMGAAGLLIGAAGWLIGTAVGGLLGGAVVGGCQAGLVRHPWAWIRRSAVGGIIVLPAPLAALFGSAGPCTGLPATLIAALAVASGLAYGRLTLHAATQTPESERLMGL